MEQKVILKSKKKLTLKQKVALLAVQKQMQLLKLREWLVVVGFVFGGAALRFVMQPIPSAEPITFFAILGGWLFGKKKGFITGASAGFLSNFIMFGGQGPWTIFQMLGWGIAGFLGGMIKDIKPHKNYAWFWLKSILPIMAIAIISTAIFDLIMNISWAFIFPYSILGILISALPFFMIHLVSNLIFAPMLPFVRKLIHEKGGFDEIEICRNIIGRFGSKHRTDSMQK